MISSHQIQDLLSCLPSAFNTNSNWFIAGGAASSSYYSDVDIYFHSLKDYQQVYNALTIAPAYESENAATFSYATALYGELTIQLIKRNFGQPIDIISNFDLNVCRNAILPDGSYISHPTAKLPLYADHKFLTWASARRIIKYLWKGFILDTTKFQNLIRHLVSVRNEPAPVDYTWDDTAGKPPNFYDVLHCLVSDERLAYLCFKVIDTLPAELRLDLYSKLIHEKSDYLPDPVYSPELQLFTSIANPKYATPLALSTYPEYFI